VASLVRSVTPYSLYTPHTGSMSYASGVNQIPAAAITVEDADMMEEMQNLGQTIVLQLYMESHFLPNSLSHNVMGELTGSEYPNQVVVIGGHIDSWDVGQGAMDDGGGILVSWEAVRLLKQLGLVAKRTVRAVGWTNEENGLAGGIAYAKAHETQNETHVFAIESDNGATTPVGLGVTAPASARQILSEIGTLLAPIGAGNITNGGGGADIDPLRSLGVPVAGLSVAEGSQQYFWFHHTEADTFDKMDLGQMQKCVATMAVMSYCVANLDDPLPRT